MKSSPIRRGAVRFAVGSADGITSNAWRVWMQKDDVYVACRDNFRETKVSLHASGRWRMGYTNEALTKNPALVADGENRAWDVWDEPPPVVPDVVLAFQLYFLSSELAVEAKQRAAKDWATVRYINPAPEGSMVVVSLLITSRDVTEIEVYDAPTEHLGALKLPSGRFAQIVACAVPEDGTRSLVEHYIAETRSRATAAGIFVPAESYTCSLGHDIGSGVRFIVPARMK